MIMMGPGGGYIDHGKYLGIGSDHLTDDGGFQTVMETRETRFYIYASKWFVKFTGVENVTTVI